MFPNVSLTYKVVIVRSPQGAELRLTKFLGCFRWHKSILRFRKWEDALQTLGIKVRLPPGIRDCNRAILLPWRTRQPAAFSARQAAVFLNRKTDHASPTDKVIQEGQAVTWGRPEVESLVDLARRRQGGA